jgi:nucleotide-binding universal stress UspA family protein
LNHILVPLDGSANAECVLPHALAFAKTFNAQISLVHVLEQPAAALGLAKADALDWYLKKSEISLYLDNLKVRLEERGASVQTLLLEGHASEKIVEFTQNNTVDLLILSDCCDKSVYDD